MQVLRLVNDLLKQPLAKGAIYQPDAAYRRGLNAIKRRFVGFHRVRLYQAHGLGKALNLLNRRHEVIAVRLWDPREVELPDIGPMIMEDAETGEQFICGHAR